MVVEETEGGQWLVTFSPGHIFTVKDAERIRNAVAIAYRKWTWERRIEKAQAQADAVRKAGQKA
jgi:hypothetical protein